ncbi:hypothetical protein TSUD_137390 [Trifolium subterraneum]|uniref:Uncharacterized protein n=1 Tax=Trifolium subterraneum TaxID=3900 RepID=A0A2Z6P5S2_TRISU|nr:hypothetical protein TSUD_137390 [Trifolium subterraneum]
MEPNRERSFDGEKRSGEQESDGGGEHCGDWNGRMVKAPSSQVATPAHTQPPIQTTAPEAFRFVPTPGFTLPHQFQQGDVAAAAIRRVIEKKFPNNITCYSDIKTPKERRTWFKRFRATKLGRPVHPDELFVVTHKKKNGEWVDRRSERTHAEYHD